MKTRDILIFITALALAILVALITRVVLKPTSQQDLIASKNSEMAKKTVLVALKDIEIGTVFSPNLFKWVEWPDNSMNPDFITKDNSARYKALNRGIIKHALEAGEPLTVQDVVQSSQGGSLSLIISPGMRALTIPFERMPFVSDLVSAGDWVDVIISGKEASDNKASSRTVLKKVKVLAVDDLLKKADATKDEKPPKTITLEVTPQQVESLTTAIKAGGDPISANLIVYFSNYTC